MNSPFNLSYAEEFSLARQGVLELNFPDLQPNGVAHGVIWRVQYEEEQNIVEEYIPQVS